MQNEEGGLLYSGYMKVVLAITFYILRTHQTHNRRKDDIMINGNKMNNTSIGMNWLIDFQQN